MNISSLAHNSTLAGNVTCGAKVGEAGDLLTGLWYIGVIISISASICSNLGMNVQKYSMVQEYQKRRMDREYQERPYICQPLWMAGMSMVVFGSLGDFLALGFTAQSLATPVGGLTMVANVIFAHLWLKEPLSKRDLFATSTILVGVVAVAISADKTEKVFTLDCLLDNYQKVNFVVYAIVMGLLLLGCYLLNRKLRVLRVKAGRKLDSAEYRKWKKIHPVLPSAFSGLVGAQSVLFAKCTAELFKVTFEGDNQFVNFATYVIVLCMFICIFAQIHWLAMGLKDFDAVVVVPVFQCFFITGSVIGGGVFFDEFSNLKAWELVAFVGGVLLTQLGVFVLAQREQSVEDGSAIIHPDDSDGGVLEKIRRGSLDSSNSLVRRSSLQSPSGSVASAATAIEVASLSGCASPQSSQGIGIVVQTVDTEFDPSQMPDPVHFGVGDVVVNSSDQAKSHGPEQEQDSETSGKSYAMHDVESGNLTLNMHAVFGGDASGEGSRPPTPMPLNVNYQAMAMADLYNAIREGLHTPDRSSSLELERGSFAFHFHHHEHHEETLDEVAEEGPEVEDEVASPSSENQVTLT